MPRRTRADMTEDTRARLIAVARLAFGTRGYARTSMDEFTAEAGLTRGALYHHFGDKQGLLAAVVEQIDAEMDARLQAISADAQEPWQGFRDRCRGYLAMAREAEYQRVVLQDARAVLGGAMPGAQLQCVASLRAIVDQLIVAGVVAPLDAQAVARLIHGSLTEASFWIAEGDDGDARLVQALAALELMLQGLRAPSRDEPAPTG
ncbi:TetR/AcrR family transcriptional regulator [Pseudomonas fontis]|uniref:TetR/AcrR family transcriptional regulator n=1 Tax=Pseudomonas fontis TaxID=2942633 RepID=A0ABT5NPD6_9PSED|nr:TetR/AcrR family transcriptional regulator [Pseudomonas fontis]MDD0974474.1 TetR/AcrR family transcriptional regulator [Pseudomonas fontis]MDD0990016.1 TetR/AcrR family transcriptional regulator [Pseudomonas fontis]